MGDRDWSDVATNQGNVSPHSSESRMSEISNTGPHNHEQGQTIAPNNWTNSELMLIYLQMCFSIFFGKFALKWNQLQKRNISVGPPSLWALMGDPSLLLLASGGPKHSLQEHDSNLWLCFHMSYSVASPLCQHRLLFSYGHICWVRPSPGNQGLFLHLETINLITPVKTLSPEKVIFIGS